MPEKVDPAENRKNRTVQTEPGRETMRFTVQQARTWPTNHGPIGMILIPDSWDDHGFKTLYDLWYRSGEPPHTVKQVGQVKIGTLDLLDGRPPLPPEFDELGDEFFSLGQDDRYYEEVRSLDDPEEIFEALRDVAFRPQWFEAASDALAMRTSLLRGLPTSTVLGQYRRIALGGARLTEYRFDYIDPGFPSTAASGSMEFAVVPESTPPTNIHVLIGSNGVGKTTLLKALSEAVAGGSSDGHFVFTEPPVPDADADTSGFANAISVSFSAFDPFPVGPAESYSPGIIDDGIVHVGLKRQTGEEGTLWAVKDPDALVDDFTSSIRECISSGGRRERWRRAVATLDSDPIFQEAGFTSLAEPWARDYDVLGEAAEQKFRRLSAGHKIVLLTLTRLVEALHERSLVLIDEPEAHLHPPLLAAFIRALSDMLIDRNGVAIVATHSPVVLQEVPKSCVWRMRRSGDQSLLDRLPIETFGENVGVLTHEVFGLEVTRSGFHAKLQRAVDKYASYEEVLNAFDGQLGGEACGMIRIMFARKRMEAGH